MTPGPLLLALSCLTGTACSEAAPGQATARGQAQGGARVQREPLPPLENVGPVAPEEWAIVPAKTAASSDSLTLKNGERDFELVDTIVQASPRTAVILYEKSGPYHGMLVKNTIIRVEPGTLPLDRSYWAFRGYDMIDARFEGVEITGFGRITKKHDEGHAFYINVAGSLSFVDCDVHDNGGQAIQLVTRPNESSLERGPAKGVIEIRNTRLRENGFNPDRGAFQIAIYSTGQAIHMEDVEITAGLSDTWPGGPTRGAIVIEADKFNPSRPWKIWWREPEEEAGFVPPFTQGKTELVRVRVHHVNPGRPIVQIKGCEELIVRDSEFKSGRIELDAPKKAGRDNGRIEWTGNRGDAEVYHRGKRIGLASEDFTIEGD